jgi:hypothetical protein
MFSESPDDRSRGQLLLVGAAVLALVIIGIVVVVNTSLFTENVEAPGVSSGVTQVSEIDYNLRQAVRTLTVRVNHQSVNHTSSGIQSQVGRNVTNLSKATRATFVASQSTAVAVDYNRGSSTLGTRVVQERDGYLTDDGTEFGQPEWRPVQGQNIGWFVLNLNVTEMENVPVHANVSNSTGASVNITMTKVNATSPDVRINTSVSGGPESSVVCDPASGRLLIDLQSGESFTDDSCRFNGTSSITNASTADFEAGDHAQGSYSVVANESGGVSGVIGGLPECRSVSPDTPCRSPVVWSANVTISVRDSTVAYENTHNISVYEVNE